MEAIKEYINVEDEKNIKARIRKIRKPIIQRLSPVPPKGFMTGDEFERRVKEELKQLYKEHGLL